jgi:hypothetical protein
MGRHAAIVMALLQQFRHRSAAKVPWKFAWEPSSVTMHVTRLLTYEAGW